MQDSNYVLWLRVLGDQGVGKSSIVKRYVEDVYTDGYLSLYSSIDFLVKRLKVDNRNIKLLIWDNYRDMRWRNIQTTYYSRNNGILVVYDVTDMESFTRAEKSWLPNIQRFASHNMKVILVGNKCDLEKQRVVTSEMGEFLAARFGCQFIETSAKMDININEAFINLTRDVVAPYIYDEPCFMKAISECVGDFTQLNIMLQGSSGTGKTSLKRLILGLPPALGINHQLSSGSRAQMMEEPVHVVALQDSNTSKIEMQELASNDPQTVELLTEIIKTHVQLSTTCDRVNFRPPFGQENKNAKQIHKAVANRRSFLSQICSKLGFSKTPPASPSPVPIDINFTPAIDKSHVLRLIYKKVLGNKSSSSLHSSKWYRLIDTSGGHPRLRNVYPLIYGSSPSIQILLMHLTKGLEDTPKIASYTVEAGQTSMESSGHLLPLTNLQYIEQACQIAASIDPPSKVLIVGTHRDKLGGNADSIIASVNDGLDDIRKQYGDVLICKSSSETIFDMNTMATGEERKENTAMLQEVIYKASMKLLMTKPEQISLKWLILQLAIDDQFIGNVFSIRDCLQLGESISMEKDEVMSALKYFQDEGSLMYYPDDGPDVVLTKTDILVEKLSQLLKALDGIMPAQTCASGHLQDKCQVLMKTGIFDKAFVDEVFPNTHSHLNNERLLSMFVCLKVAMAIGNGEYFIPSALSNHYRENNTSLSCGFALGKDRRIPLPCGLFFTTIIMLLDDSNGYKFKLCKDKQQYCNRITLQDTNRNHIVTLTDRASYGWIQVGLASGNHQHCRSIHTAVKGAIKQALKRLRHHVVNEQQSLIEVFPCPLEGHANHYCTLSINKKKYICSKDDTLVGSITQDMACWTGRDELVTKLGPLLLCVCVCFIAVMYYHLIY